jgi:TDP-4-keto-6-deoxy-D-glucose transaminase
MIKFNVSPYVKNSDKYIAEAANSHFIGGDGPFTHKCQDWMESKFHAQKVLLTTSCTTALEMAAILCKIKPGDEVILPSYTFSTTATSFVQRGAKLVFVDIRPDTMNIDEKKIEAAITPKTKAICVVHYAGVACEMDTIMDIAHRHNLKVVEDAAQGVMAKYKDRFLGTIGDFGCYSFHETKNYSMGEGGALVVNHPEDNDNADILWDCGTDRCLFIRGVVEKYEWVDYGSSFLPSDINAAYLLSQLEIADGINNDRLESWHRYYQMLKPLAEKGLVRLPIIPKECTHNAHMFYLILKDFNTRNSYISFMKQNGICCYFHYVPLHSAPAGIKFGRFHGVDENTTQCSQRLVRLPMYYHLSKEDQDLVVKKTFEFFGEKYDTL